MSWHFEWITSWDEVFSPSFQAQWQRWSDEASNSHVFFHPALSSTWIETYRPLRDIRPLFLVGRNEEATVFFPLVLWKQNWKNAWRRLIVPVGHSDFDYHDPLAIGPEKAFSWDGFWGAFCSEVKAEWAGSFDALEIDGVREPFISRLAGFIPEDECPFIDLTPFRSLDEFLGSLKSKTRTDLHRRQRRLNELGEVSFRKYLPEEGETAVASMEHMLQHHSSRWPNAFKAPGFHTGLVRSCLQLNMVHFSELRLNASPISWRLGFVFGNRFYSYMPAFVLGYSDFSPGKIHLAKCIGGAAERKLSVYDQLKGTEGYKGEWATGSVRLYRLRLQIRAGSSDLRNWAALGGRRLLGRDREGGRQVVAGEALPAQKGGPRQRTLSGNWAFEWITSWDEVWSSSFQADWQRAADEAFSSHVFFHPALAKAWVETYQQLQDIRPCFLLARTPTGKVILPLVLWRRNWKNAWQRLIVPVGHSDYDYHDPLAAGDSERFDWAGFWTALERELIHRWGKEFDGVEIPGIREPFGASLPAEGQQSSCPCRDLSGFSSGDDFPDLLKKALRGDLGRQRRRLSQLGDLRCHTYQGGEAEDAVRALPGFLGAHSRRWPKAYKAPGLHERLVRAGLAANVLHFSELRLNGRPCSWHLGFAWKSRFYYHLPAIDSEFAAYSPGKLHLLVCIQDAIRMRLKMFDFLRGDEAYKAGWADQTMPVRAYTLRHTALPNRMRNLFVEQVKARLAR